MITRINSSYEVDHEIQKEIDKLSLNNRLKGLKERYLETTPKLASDRSTCYAVSWRETEGQPIQIPDPHESAQGQNPQQQEQLAPGPGPLTRHPTLSPVQQSGTDQKEQDAPCVLEPGR